MIAAVGPDRGPPAEVDAAPLAVALADLALARDRCQLARNVLHGPLISDDDRCRERYAWLALRARVDALLDLFPVADPDPED